MQRIVEMSYQPFAQRVKRLLADEQSRMHYPGAGEKLDCGSACIEIGTGKISFSLRQWCKHQINFIKHWFFVICATFITRDNPGTQDSAVLVYGIGDESLFQDGSDSRFVEYCKTCDIEPLNRKKRYFIESHKSNSARSHGDFNYRQRPLIALAQESKLGLVNRLYLFSRLFLLLPAFYKAMYKCPHVTLIGHEFVYAKLAQLLNDLSMLDCIVLTCSNYTEQALFTRVLKQTPVHMIWYAQAWKPIVYIDDPVESDVPNLRWIRTDTHWVWTRSFADYLNKLGIVKEVKVVGPIVWCLPEHEEYDDDWIRIVVFDASPFSDEVALINGQITNYHHPDNLFKFINDILELSSKIEDKTGKYVDLVIKTKRGFKPLYDRAYFDYLNTLASSGKIRLVHHSENPFRLISGSNLLIAYPFTSTCYIADYIKVSSIYYDPTGMVLEHHFGDQDSKISFSSGPSSLEHTLETVLGI